MFWWKMEQKHRERRESGVLDTENGVDAVAKCVAEMVFSSDAVYCESVDDDVICWVCYSVVC